MAPFCDRGVLLVDDRASRVVDDGDGAGHPLRPVVGGGAACRLLRTYRDSLQATCRGRPQQRRLVNRVAAAGGGQRRPSRRRHTKPFEFRRFNVETLVPQGFRDVVDAGVIPRRAFRAGPVVRVGDLLKLAQVDVHAVDADPVRQVAGEVLRRWRRRRTATEQQGDGDCRARQSLMSPPARLRRPGRHDFASTWRVRSSRTGTPLRPRWSCA